MRFKRSRKACTVVSDEDSGRRRIRFGHFVASCDSSLLFSEAHLFSYGIQDIGGQSGMLEGRPCRYLCNIYSFGCENNQLLDPEGRRSACASSGERSNILMERISLAAPVCLLFRLESSTGNCSHWGGLARLLVLKTVAVSSPNPLQRKSIAVQDY